MYQNRIFWFIVYSRYLFDVNDAWCWRMGTFYRQGITELEKGAQSSLCTSQSCREMQFPKIRHDIVTFLNCLMSHVHSLGCEGNDDFLQMIIKEILDTLLFLGPLHELQEHVTSAGSPQGNKVWVIPLLWFTLWYACVYSFMVSFVVSLWHTSLFWWFILL